MAKTEMLIPEPEKTLEEGMLPDPDRRLLPDPAEPYDGAHPHDAAAEVPLHQSPHLPLDISISDLLIDAGASGMGQAQRHEARTRLIEARTGAVGDQVRQDAADRGFGDMQGLSITLGNGYRYVVRDVCNQQERREETARTWLPRFQHSVGAFGNKRGGGLGSFSRSETPTRQRKIHPFPTGRPYIDQRGFPRLSGVRLGDHGQDEQGGMMPKRPVTGLERKFQTKPVVAVEVYDEDGQLKEINIQRRDSTGDGEGKNQGALDEIFNLAGEHGVMGADWEERWTPPTDTEQVNIDLPDYASRDRRSTEAEGKDAPAVFDVITAQLEDAGIRNCEGLSWNRRTPGSPGEITQKVVADKAVKERTQDGYEWVRTFLVRTAHRTPNGTTVSDELMSEGKFRSYLEGGTEALNFEDMQLEREKPPAAAAYAPSPYDLDVEDALALLSYPEAHLRNPQHKTQDERNAGLRDHIEEIRNSEEHQQSAEEILASIDEVGFDRFYEVVTGMHEEFATSAKHLRIDKSWDISDSFVLHELMKMRIDGKAADLFEDSLEANKLRASIVDRLIGERFREVNMPIEGVEPVPTGRLIDKGGGKIVPETQVKPKVGLNAKWFGRQSVVDGPAREAKKKRDKIWEPIKKQAVALHKLYVKEVQGEDEEVPDEAYEEFGRALRRTVAQ